MVVCQGIYKEKINMKKLFIVIMLCSLAFLSSCASPKATVTSITDMKESISSEGIIVVSDVGKHLGPKFRMAFEGKLMELAGPHSKLLGIMPYMGFIRSPYNKPDVNDSFSNRLFVFVSTRGSSTYQYSVTSIDYLMEVKYLKKEPFLVQKIHLGTGTTYLSSDQQRGDELARAVFEELKNRKIL